MLNFKKSTLANLNWLIIVTTISILYFTIYFSPVSLHDIAHYIIAGKSYLHFHNELIYPYNVESYEHFQNTSKPLELTINYPSKLYSMLYGIMYLITGKLLFQYTHLITLLMLIINNILLYLIGRRFLNNLHLVCFLVSVNFLPVMQFNVNPGSHIFGYFSVLFLLWLSLSIHHTKTIHLGFLAGILFHFRTQSITLLFIIPLIIKSLNIREKLRQLALYFIIGSTISYISIDLSYKLIISSETHSNGMDFYINYFKNSFYSLENISLITHKLKINVLNLFNVNQLYFIPALLLISLSIKSSHLQRSLVIGSIIYISVPLIIYSLDKTFLPQPKYYIPAIPLALLAWYITITMHNKISLFSSKVLSSLTASFVLLAWLNVNGCPFSQIPTSGTIYNRLTFLDFENADIALQNHFNSDSLLMINHSLPSGLTYFKYVLGSTKLSTFKKGDNRSIDGIVFVYGDATPNDFFKPYDWIKQSVLPDFIQDDYHLTFKKIFDEKSKLLSFDGKIQDTAHFVVYKNTNINSNLEFNSLGKRVFYADNGLDLKRQRVKSPFFELAKDWTGLNENIQNRNGIVVGPSPLNKNVIYQLIDIKPNEKLKINAVISSVGNRPTKGRLQINWLNNNKDFISSSIKIINLSKQKQSFSTAVMTPTNAKYGILYATPHGNNDIVKFYELSVLGK